MDCTDLVQDYHLLPLRFHHSHHYRQDQEDLEVQGMDLECFYQGNSSLSLQQGLASLHLRMDPHIPAQVQQFVTHALPRKTPYYYQRYPQHDQLTASFKHHAHLVNASPPLIDVVVLIIDYIRLPHVISTLLTIVNQPSRPYLAFCSNDAI